MDPIPVNIGSDWYPNPPKLIFKLSIPPSANFESVVYFIVPIPIFAAVYNKFSGTLGIDTLNVVVPIPNTS